MAGKVLMRGTHVLGEAAIRAGCRAYFGYPITPQNELPEYMAAQFAKMKDGIFVQAESELASINMVMGASIAGARVMTSSSSPGISLKQEGISYLAAMELPAVIVNMMRGGPGLGNIAPSQGDYFQATRGGGHGDYRLIVLAPAYGQEIANMTRDAFDLADRFRTPVMILGDGMMGQMMEPVIFPEPIDLASLPKKDWILDGCKERSSRIIRSLWLDPNLEEELNWRLARKYEIISEEIPDAEMYQHEDAEIIIVAYGTAARIAKGAVQRVREAGKKIGLFRPKTLWPYPNEPLAQLSRKVKHIVVFELSTGQMVEDVRLAVEGRCDVSFYGRPGGVVPTGEEIARVLSATYHRVNSGRQNGSEAGSSYRVLGIA
ncbi:3-methyl-2-oxobutanoate dehydrogenase subunit VorB [Desulfomonile tiedjei]|uniref:2-oxoacid:ferredoxin oxidoreductase, alpha subunit n=1 Tax=Desulfomonile tiedjei (strain ATCC 49306 / DSM 6799 / DCB-1) TaxID=706587 RepID=I4C813_DESTA|nr:3-methyl-2-oxobutanoate dehydrogenase subunit VorB [Desulfomonile tiedjei]AFM25704.1 2-oxoacid:ferredoxin oxidoreductase, alpha subunit [Desulfomonile tiedjei DSM 6799]